MKTKALFKEDLELHELRQTQQELIERQRESAENQKRIAEEHKDRENTMPPLEEIQTRIARRVHEQSVTRGEVCNELRVQNRSLALLLLLVTATGTLIWWGMTLMQGG